MDSFIDKSIVNRRGGRGTCDDTVEPLFEDQFELIEKVGAEDKRTAQRGESSHSVQGMGISHVSVNSCAERLPDDSDLVDDFGRGRSILNTMEILFCAHGIAGEHPDFVPSAGQALGNSLIDSLCSTQSGIVKMGDKKYPFFSGIHSYFYLRSLLCCVMYNKQKGEVNSSGTAPDSF